MLQYTSTLEIALRRIAISNLPDAILKLHNLSTQFRNWLAIFNFSCAISKLRKFANCAQHIHKKPNHTACGDTILNIFNNACMQKGYLILVQRENSDQQLMQEAKRTLERDFLFKQKLQ